jgi:hypothetical protein
MLTYFPSSLISNDLMLSVWPTSFAILFPPALGSYILTTLSGDPAATRLPEGVVARA